MLHVTVKGMIQKDHSAVWVVLYMALGCTSAVHVACCGALGQVGDHICLFSSFIHVNCVPPAGDEHGGLTVCLLSFMGTDLNKHARARRETIDMPRWALCGQVTSTGVIDCRHLANGTLGCCGGTFNDGAQGGWKVDVYSIAVWDPWDQHEL